MIDFLKKESEEEILQRLLKKTPNDLNKLEGSFIYDALAPAAFELYQQREFSRHVVMQAFVRYAEGPFLDEHAKDYGTERSFAYAEAAIHIAGEAGTTVPQNTQMSTEDMSIIFKTDEDAVISSQGNVVVGATCTTIGTAGNVSEGEIKILLDHVEGVSSITNPEPASNGRDVEEDESFRSRLLFLKENKEKGGADSDHERWALQVPGVQWAKAIDKARGIGTVDVVISGEPGTIDDLVVQVQIVIDSKKISGIDVKVRKVNVRGETFEIGVTGITEENARSAAIDYLDSVGVGGKIILSKIVTAIIIAGATDATIYSPHENIQLEPDCIIDPVVNIT